MVITSEQYGWVCIFGCHYHGPRDANHYREAHPEYWQRSIAVEDRVVVGRAHDEALWGWSRFAPDGRLVAMSTEGFATPAEAQDAAIRINNKPYILELLGSTPVASDLSGEVTQNTSTAGSGFVATEDPASRTINIREAP